MVKTSKKNTVDLRKTTKDTQIVKVILPNGDEVLFDLSASGDALYLWNGEIRVSKRFQINDVYEGSAYNRVKAEF